MRQFYLLLCLGFSVPALAVTDGLTDVHKVSKHSKSSKLHYSHKVHDKALALPATSQADSSSTFKVTGYLDGSYNYETRNKFTSGSYDRVFDLVPNGLTLQQAATTMAYQPSQGLGGLLNLIAGRDANGTASYNFKPETEFDSQTLAVDFTQAYLQYASGHTTVMVGRFTTLVGVEQIDPTLDTNFSRGNLFYNTPDTHTGLRVVYAASDKLSLTAGVNDGWDNFSDWSRRKTLELGVSYTVNPILSFSVQGYNGQERATPRTSTGPLGMRTLIDFIVTVNATDKLTLIANYDNGRQSKAALPTGLDGRAAWAGIAGYVNYKFTDKWRASLRCEVFDDENGYRTGVRQNWREATLTIAYAPIKNMELRAETRHDFSNVNAFVSSTGSSISNHQQSYALEGIYKFG